MAAPTMSYLICSMGLIILIIVMPFFFAIERNSFAEQIAERELTEISDYTSNTLANLFFLANSTNSESIDVTKELLYLPLTVQGSFYTLNITFTDSASALKVFAFLQDSPSVVGYSWLLPGLKLLKTSSVNITDSSVIAGCHREAEGFSVWLGES